MGKTVGRANKMEGVEDFHWIGDDFDQHNLGTLTMVSMRIL